MMDRKHTDPRLACPGLADFYPAGCHFGPKAAASTRTWLVAGLLVVGLWCSPSAAHAQTGTSGTATGASQGIGAASGQLPTLDTLRATRERPLFTPSRRPPVVVPPPPPVAPVAAVQAPPPAPPPSDQLILTGIVKGGDTRVAVLRNAETNEIYRLQRGEKALGWAVKEIEIRTVLLSKDSKTLKLELFPEVKR